MQKVYLHVYSTLNVHMGTEFLFLSSRHPYILIKIPLDISILCHQSYTMINVLEVRLNERDQNP